MVDDGRTTDGRTPDHGHPISSPCEPDGSGELKIDGLLVPPGKASMLLPDHLITRYNNIAILLQAQRSGESTDSITSMFSINISHPVSIYNILVKLHLLKVGQLPEARHNI